MISTDPLSARLVAPDSDGAACEVDILKENLWSPPRDTEYGPVLSLDDVIGTKVRALADRGAVRDLIDVHAAAEHHIHPELEQLGQRHGRDAFRLDDLRDRLAGAEWYDDEEFAAYSLTEAPPPLLHRAADTAVPRTRRIRCPGQRLGRSLTCPDTLGLVRDRLSILLLSPRVQRVDLVIAARSAERGVTHFGEKP